MTADELVMKIRNEFEGEISKKTGWGKNEIIRVLDSTIMKVSLSELKNKIGDQNDAT